MLTLRRDDFVAWITGNDDGTATLGWRDAIGLNDWAETFPTLPTALARLAVLVACEPSTPNDDPAFFVNDPEIFAQHAQTFLAKEMTR